MSNSLDPDQARQNVGPCLDPNCLQRLSADGTSMESVTMNTGVDKKFSALPREKSIFVLSKLYHQTEQINQDLMDKVKRHFIIIIIYQYNFFYSRLKAFICSCSKRTNIQSL